MCINTMFTLLHKEESSVVFVEATLKVKLINFNSVQSVVAMKYTKSFCWLDSLSW